MNYLEYAKKARTRHLDAIELICKASVSVGIVPEVFHWGAGTVTIHCGVVMFSIKLGKVTEWPKQGEE